MLISRLRAHYIFYCDGMSNLHFSSRISSYAPTAVLIRTLPTDNSTAVIMVTLLLKLQTILHLDNIYIQIQPLLVNGNALLCEKGIIVLIDMQMQYLYHINGEPRYNVYKLCLYLQFSYEMLIHNGFRNLCSFLILQ